MVLKTSALPQDLKATPHSGSQPQDSPVLLALALGSAEDNSDCVRFQSDEGLLWESPPQPPQPRPALLVLSPSEKPCSSILVLQFQQVLNPDSCGTTILVL